MEVQIKFEESDMSNNTDYFKKNLEEYHAQFSVHSLASNNAFEFVNFCGWLQSYPGLINIKKYLEKFKKIET